MSIFQWLNVAMLGAVVAAPLALAQPSEQTRPDPADPQARVAAPTYTSAFDGYVRWHDDAKAPDQHWPQANKDMTRLGGHAGHLREAASQGKPVGDKP